MWPLICFLDFSTFCGSNPIIGRVAPFDRLCKYQKLLHLPVSLLFPSESTSQSILLIPLIAPLFTFCMQIPKLLYREATSCLPSPASGTPPEARSKWLHHRLSIFAPDNIHRSIFHTASSSDSASTSAAASDSDVAVSGCFGFTRMLGLSPGEVSGLAQATALERWAFYWQREAARVRRREIDEVFREGQEVNCRE